MKWSKTSLELDDENVQGNDRKDYFKEYKRVKVDDSLPPGKWKAYGIKPDGSKQELYEWITYYNLDRLKRGARRKYEIFVGGFLNFYDEQLKDYPKKIADEYPIKLGEEFSSTSFQQLKKFFDKVGVGVKHEVYFDWGQDEKNPGKMSLTIYIHPDAGDPNPPPPPPPPPPESNP